MFSISSFPKKPKDSNLPAVIRVAQIFRKIKFQMIQDGSLIWATEIKMEYRFICSGIVQNFILKTPCLSVVWNNARYHVAFSRCKFRFFFNILLWGWLMLHYCYKKPMQLFGSFWFARTLEIWIQRWSANANMLLLMLFCLILFFQFDYIVASTGYRDYLENNFHFWEYSSI